jgi:hypothetical protein
MKVTANRTWVVSLIALPSAAQPPACAARPKPFYQNQLPHARQHSIKNAAVGVGTTPLLDTMGGSLKKQVVFGKFFRKANYTIFFTKGVTYHERKNQ